MIDLDYNHNGPCMFRGLIFKRQQAHKCNEMPEDTIVLWIDGEWKTLRDVGWLDWEVIPIQGVCPFCKVVLEEVR